VPSLAVDPARHVWRGGYAEDGTFSLGREGAAAAAGPRLSEVARRAHARVCACACVRACVRACVCVCVCVVRGNG